MMALVFTTHSKTRREEWSRLPSLIGIVASDTRT